MTDFLDLPSELADLEQARAVVLAIPFEKTTTYGRGTKYGPEAIIAASTQVELYDEVLNTEPCQIGIATVRPWLKLDCVPERAVEEISAACEELLRQNKFVAALGGEHTVSVGVVRAFQKFYPHLSVLQLDAHSDLRDSYLGSRLNHACVMARIQELCPYVGVGIRSSIAGEQELLRPPSRIFYAWEMVRESSWQEQVMHTLGQQVYITIDLDFFDPAVVPSVGSPEPGGFHWYETLNFLRKVIQSRQVVGFDVVELRPRPEFPASDFLAARLVYKLLGYVFEGVLAT